MSQLEGKIVAVTGAGQGLGRATCIALQQAGARVALLGRTLSKLEETLEKMGGDGVAIAADVTNPDSVRKAFAQIKEKLGGLDVLINNAALYQIFKIEAATDEQIQSTVNTNLTGPIYCTREAIPLMRERGGGQIINLSSESVNHPVPYLIHYAAAKGGLEVLTRGLKEELRPDNIRVTLLRVGGMNDPDKSAGSQFDPAVVKEFYEAFVASGRDKMVGSLMELETVVGCILRTLETPKDASVDLMELRSI